VAYGERVSTTGSEHVRAPAALRITSLFAAFAVSVCVLAGCAPTNIYGPVDAVADKLHVGSLGKHVDGWRQASGGPASDKPSHFFVIGGSTALSMARARLTNAGFTEHGSNLWRKGSARAYMAVVLHPIAPGAGYVNRTGTVIPTSEGLLELVIEAGP
jgi:hypothetical protein